MISQRKIHISSFVITKPKTGTITTELSRVTFHSSNFTIVRIIWDKMAHINPSQPEQ